MHKKIIEYKILSSHAEQVAKMPQLDKLVNGHIAEGWQPKGCLIIDSEGTLHQVVVKYEPLV
jgi:uncharacterized protein YccT (UPF0319 family)